MPEDPNLFPPATCPVIVSSDTSPPLPIWPSTVTLARVPPFSTTVHFAQLLVWDGSNFVCCGPGSLNFPFLAMGDRQWKEVGSRNQRFISDRRGQSVQQVVTSSFVSKPTGLGEVSYANIVKGCIPDKGLKDKMDANSATIILDLWIPDFIEEDRFSEEEEGEGSAHVEVHPSYGVGINENEDLSEKIPDCFENEEFTFHDNVEEINKDEVEEERDTNDPFGIIRLLEKQPLKESPLTDDSIGVDFSHQETKVKSNIPIAEKFTAVSRATRPVSFEGEVNSKNFASCEQLLW
ncbi:hypothetical protein L6452_01044 [Arctium lappa]|uniref:Uncharacterized protein n=1 Tax=Arctium lappa TaxID=4217 RepID=A0ACB9FGG3_ARCLA|nr:hypothetical protein L6452_01044 [Arctium lappa]